MFSVSIPPVVAVLVIFGFSIAALLWFVFWLAKLGFWMLLLIVSRLAELGFYLTDAYYARRCRCFLDMYKISYKGLSNSETIERTRTIVKRQERIKNYQSDRTYSLNSFK